MSATTFPPLSVHVKSGKYCTITSVQEASALVLTWRQGGPKRRAALEACLAALQGGSAEKARQCFLAAAEEAHVNVREGEYPVPSAKAMSPSWNSPGGRISWVRIRDTHPDMKGEEHHYVALDDARQGIGSVRRIEYGIEHGRWMWAMTRVQPGKPFLAPRFGTEKTRREAALALVTSWHAFIKWYRLQR